MDWPRHKPTLRTDPSMVQRRGFENRASDKRHGRLVCVPVRYADDFIVGAPEGPEAQQVAEREKAVLARHLKATFGLELSPSKTLVTPVTSSMPFLGHIIKARLHRGKPGYEHGPGAEGAHATAATYDQRALRPTHTRPKPQRSTRKAQSHPTRVGLLLSARLGAKRVSISIDHYVWNSILATLKELARRFAWRKPSGRMLRWRDSNQYCFRASTIRVAPYRMAWMPPSHLSSTSMESPVR